MAKVRREQLGFDFPDSWEYASFDEVFVIVSGVTKGQRVPAKEAIDVPYLRVANVQRGHLDLAVVKTITVRKADKERYLLRCGDILMTEGGDWDKLGRAAIWRGEVAGCIHQNHVFRVRPPSNEIVPEWVTTYVNSLAGRAFFENASKQTTNLASINMTQLSRREKEYVVHPYRLVYAQNALYLQAYVPDYAELRTFLVDRIRRLTAQQGTFERVAGLSADPFGKSMGVHTRPTIAVRLLFHPRIAPIIRERTWHASQQLRDRPDGALAMSLQVSDDYALRQWILGFGRFVRVLAPATLAEWVLEELDEARAQYVTGEFGAVLDEDVQPPLPFMFSRI